MAIGWFIVPYVRLDRPIGPTRYPAIDNYTDQIRAAGGYWSETEVLGNRCIVKVRAPEAGLTQLAGIFKRLPKDRLDDSLADLPTGVKATLRDEILDMGYTLAEIQERFGDDLGQYTLRDVLRFMARRRLKPRYNRATDEIILDGPEQVCRPVEDVDAEVSE